MSTTIQLVMRNDQPQHQYSGQAQSWAKNPGLYDTWEIMVSPQSGEIPNREIT